MGDGSHELATTLILRNILEAYNFTNSLGWVILANSLSGSVWVVGFELKWVGLNVLEGIVHESTIATVVLLRAVNKLLLRERSEFVSGNLPSTLNGTGGRESPA